MKKTLFLFAFLFAVATLFCSCTCEHAECTQATCEAPSTCLSCGVVVKEALGHAETVDAAVAPTCTETGLTAGKHCSICAKTLVEQTTVAATGHTEVLDAAVAPTCTKTGLTEGKHCSVCQKVLTVQQVLAVSSHTYTDKYDVSCNVCGFVRDADCAHTEVETVKGYAATCTATGRTDGTRCSACQEVLLVQEVIPSTGHSAGDWTTTVTATCITSGVDKKFCSICGAVEDVRTTPLAAHTPGEWEVTATATCTASGVEKRICTVCNATVDMRTTPLAPHAYTQYECTEINHWKKCANCAATLEKEAHAIANDGSCSTCGSKNAATEGIVYDISNDGTYAIVADYVGASTKVKIAETYNGLPVKEIAGFAFEAKGISSVVVPDSVTTIGLSAFQSCTRLKSVTMGTGITSIGLWAFEGCDNLDSVYIADLEKWCAIDSVGKNYYDLPVHNGADLYLNGTLLTEVVIPDSITDIGFAFTCCTSLTSVVIPNSVTSINIDAFYGCTNLTSIIIPDSVTSIDYYAFCGCESLTSVTIPDSVTSIGQGAFYGCQSLTSVTIPSGVTKIGEDAFNDCASLTSIIVASDNANYCSIDGNLYNKSGTTLIQYAIGKTSTSFIIPETVWRLSDSAFYNCASLTSITIPVGVYDIYYSTFLYCTNLTTVYYSGTAYDWGGISFIYGNSLENATIYYYSTTQPTGEGNYWRYVNGVPTAW